MQILIDKTKEERIQQLQRKLDFVIGKKMPITGMTAFPVMHLMALHYDLQIRDLVMDRLLTMMESLFDGIEEDLLMPKILETFKEGRKSLAKNPFVEMTAQSVEEMEKAIKTQCSDWDD